MPRQLDLERWVLDRVGVSRRRSAYLRIAVSPDNVRGDDLEEVRRRPSRGLPQWAGKWMARCRSIDGLRDAADRIDDAKVADKFRGLAEDLDLLVGIARRGATARELLVAVRDKIGLGTAMSLLDSTGAAGGSHLDDIEGLIQVADLQPDAAKFSAGCATYCAARASEDGVTLSTIHRVKGREWDHVVVYGVTDGMVPHRLAEDVEEERRVLHVAITRGRHRVLVLGDAGRRSPFLAELDGSAARGPYACPARPRQRQSALRQRRPPVRCSQTRAAEIGLKVTVTGGYEGVIDSIDETGVRVLVSSDARLFVRFGERVQIDGRFVALTKPPSPLAEAAESALRAWRTARAKSDGVPAFVVLNDKHLTAIAERHPTSLAELRLCPGIGPAKLETFGEEILEVLSSVGGAS